jgi:hypothetical protein
MCGMVGVRRSIEILRVLADAYQLTFQSHSVDLEDLSKDFARFHSNYTDGGRTNSTKAHPPSVRPLVDHTVPNNTVGTSNMIIL